MDEFESFKQSLGSVDVLGGLDDQDDLNDDETYQMAHDVCQEILESGASMKESMFSILQYLELISVRAKGFSYERIAVATNGTRKLLGLLWMTATMRRNYELYGTYLCLDMMKRAINKLAWPYTGIALYDEMGHICIALEGFVCGERYEMYLEKVRFLSRYAPKRPISSVTIVSGDGFFDKAMIMKLGFVNAEYVADWWHMKDSGL